MHNSGKNTKIIKWMCKNERDELMFLQMFICDGAAGNSCMLYVAVHACLRVIEACVYWSHTLFVNLWTGFCFFLLLFQTLFFCLQNILMQIFTFLFMFLFCWNLTVWNERNISQDPPPLQMKLKFSLGFYSVKIP